MDESPGQIIILNGAPRAGKSSIAAAIQETFDGPWMNLGTDTFVLAVTPPRLRPGVGLRPGGERQDLEPLVPIFFAAMYESIAATAGWGSTSSSMSPTTMPTACPGGSSRRAPAGWPASRPGLSASAVRSR